jgi:hypothetical protein
VRLELDRFFYRPNSTEAGYLIIDVALRIISNAKWMDLCFFGGTLPNNKLLEHMTWSTSIMLIRLIIGSN